MRTRMYVSVSGFGTVQPTDRDLSVDPQKPLTQKTDSRKIVKM